jgi:hypothetical protein
MKNGLQLLRDLNHFLLNFEVYFLGFTVINFLLFVLSNIVRNLCMFKCGRTHLHMRCHTCHYFFV